MLSLAVGSGLGEGLPVGTDDGAVLLSLVDGGSGLGEGDCALFSGDGG